MEQKQKRKAFTFLVSLLTVLALSCSACTEGSESGASSFEQEKSDFQSEQTAETSVETPHGELTEEASSSSEEPSEEPSEESSEESNEESSEESSEDLSEESSEDLNKPQESFDEMTKMLADLDGSGIFTNIQATEGSEVAKILAALEDYLTEQSDFSLCFSSGTGDFYYVYNAGEKFSTASTVKLPYARYLLGLADEGEIDLSEEMTYTKDFYNSGSGRIKGMDEGTVFSVKKLIQYAVKYSDNIAYGMLLSRYGTKGFNAHLEELGVSFSVGSNGYGSCTVAEMTALFFDFHHYNGKNKEFLKETLLSTSYNAQIGAGIKDYPVGQKFGCQISPDPSRRIYHDVAVVYAPEPYVLGIFSRLDWNSSTKNAPFIKFSALINELNEELSHSKEH